ncbi:MAG: SoxR reducing system RseC family protein [Eubacteriaceae bacterium]|jgi:sigma-E factor negative regulatory protein RseC|nr:SoxR reducing system RseC family protein [Eubacteriaceae bacterium]
MKEIGLVKKIKGNKAVVEIQRHVACGDCHACDVGKDKSTMKTEAKNEAHAKVGDAVAVEMEFGNLMRVSAIVYGIPLIAFFIGCFAGYYLAPSLGWDSTYSAFVTGIVLTAITFLMIRFMDRKGAFKDKRYAPVVTEVLGKEALEALKTDLKNTQQDCKSHF